MSTFFTITIRWFQVLFIVLLVVLISTLTGYFSSAAEQFFSTIMLLIATLMVFVLVAMFCGFMLRANWGRLNRLLQIGCFAVYTVLFVSPTLYYSFKLLYETFL